MLEPSGDSTDPRALLLAYLDAYRAEALRKADVAAPLPTPWKASELIHHLALMERRWLVWGFAGEAVDGPWTDSDAEDRWTVPAGTTTAALAAQLLAGGRRTREIAEAAALTDRGATGGRFDGSAPPPTLLAILVHVLQEYARHTGQLDVARELTDGLVGESASAPPSRIGTDTD